MNRVTASIMLTFLLLPLVTHTQATLLNPENYTPEQITAITEHIAKDEDIEKKKLKEYLFLLLLESGQSCKEPSDPANNTIFYLKLGCLTRLISLKMQ